MRIAFMGTPDFAVPTLRALVDAGHGVERVYSQPARPAGRGRAPRASAVARAAEELGLPVATPERFRGAPVAEFAALALDAAVVVAYGQILPVAALAAPRFGCLNLHASLLPRWRGAAPIQRAIMAGDAETGVCAMRMEAGLDTGPVLDCRSTPIGPEDTAGTLHDRLATIGAGLMVEVLDGLAAARLTPRPQTGTGVTYAPKIDKAEARIDWTGPAGAVAAHIRGLSPHPGAWCEIAGERVRVLMAHAVAGEGPPGTVLDDALAVACLQGAVRLTRLQRAGRAAGDAATVLRGFAVPAGTRLG